MVLLIFRLKQRRTKFFPEFVTVTLIQDIYKQANLNRKFLRLLKKINERPAVTNETF